MTTEEYFNNQLLKKYYTIYVIYTTYFCEQNFGYICSPRVCFCILKKNKYLLFCVSLFKMTIIID